ncbi:MAG: hypothetical protein SFU98_00790 [Leptospiraceae bacterium]|nr:hypothetical protein [Leptospiraceae bacterium]
MSEFGKFFKDKSIIASVLIILFAEFFLQLGCYRPFLKKNSFAYNIRKIVFLPIANKEKLNPEILLMGSSLAYEGISARLLNEELLKSKYKVQNVSISGSELITQSLALEEILKKLDKTKILIHFADIQTAWLDRKVLNEATLAMISELDRMKAYEKIQKDQYEYTWKDISFLILKLVSYKKDFADFFLNPANRFREIVKNFQKESNSAYTYENTYKEAFTVYNFSDLKTCIDATLPSKPIAKGSDEYHKDAVFRTCLLADTVKVPFGETKETNAFKLRLKNFYDEIEKKGIKIILVYPPVPNILEKEKYKQRIEFWNSYYSNILPKTKIDLSNIIPEENNGDYYYDMAHLNAKGMRLFTEGLAKELNLILTETK